jgi:cytosine/adenosine deaminase-related metal-dependent hydrolase
MKHRTIIRECSLLAGDELRYIEKGWLVCEDGRITDYGEGSLSEGTWLPDTMVIPAFIDAHTHIGDTAAKEAGVGMPTIKAVSPPDGMKYRILRSLSETEHIESMRHGAHEFLYNGIAAFGDFREEGIFGIKKLRSALEGLPLEPVIFGEPDWEKLSCDGYEEAVAKIIIQAKGIGIGDIADFPEERLKYLSALAGGQHKVIAVHAAETREAQDKCREQWGKGEIERVAALLKDILLIHVTNPSPHEIDLIAERHVPVVLCPRTNAILSDGLPPVLDFIRKGIPFALGTDNMMFTSPDMFREMDFLSRIGRAEAASPEMVISKEILKGATINGAVALGAEKHLGSLEVGKKASFLAINLNSMNLRYIKDPYSALIHRAGTGDISQRWFDGKLYDPFHPDQTDTKEVSKG